MYLCKNRNFNVALMPYTFKTISQMSTGVYKEKGSKFISFAIPVTSVEEVKEIIKNYRKEYYDARHVCFAYMIGAEKDEFRANDDGEPSGTAGRPILGQINSFELTNILIVVIRYFGGILLGTSGLITAYKEAAFDALQQADLIEKTVDVSIEFSFDYLSLNDVMKLIKLYPVEIVKQKFDTQCEMEITTPKQFEDQLISRLSKIDNVSLNFK